MSTEQGATKNKTKIQLLLMTTAFILLILSFVSLKPIIILLLLLIYCIVIAMFFNPLVGLFLLLIIRPCFDILSNEPIIIIGDVHLNFASLTAIIALIFSFVILAANFKKTEADKKFHLKEIPLIFPISLFLLITFISSFFSPAPLESVTEWTRLLSIFSLYILGYLIVKTEKNLTRLLKVIIVSAIIPSVFALYQFFTQTGITVPFEGIYNRIYGTFAHPNLFAYYLIIPLSLSLFLPAAMENKKIAKIILAIVAVFLFMLLFLTYTRGAWLAFIIAVIFISLASFRKYGKFLVAIFLIIAFSYSLIEPVNKRVNDLIFNPYSSIRWRLSLWQDSFNYAKEKPLLGHGTGMAKDLILKKRGYKFGSADPHNDYLKIALENGLLGLLSYFFLIIYLFATLLKKFRKAESQNIKSFALILLGITASLYIMSSADNILRNTALQWSYWALIGALLASNKFDKNI